MQRLLTLEAGALRAVVIPGRGGALASLRWGEVDLLRPGPVAGEGPPIDLGCFAMLPLCNRVRHNVLRLGARSWPVAANMPPQPLHLHGTGWTSAWEVVEETPAAVLRRLDSAEAPWRYRAEQRIALTEAALTIELAIENRAGEAMPFGLGLHPYFPVTPRMTMRFAARRFWLMDGDKLPCEPITVPPELDHATARATPIAFRNNVYQDWDGVAELAWPEHGAALTLRADPTLAHLMLYRPPAQPLVALEPMSHVPGTEGHGWRALAPGERMAARLHFHPRALIA